MREEERVMLRLTGRALFGAKTDFTSVDWLSVYRECGNQALTILIWDTLSDAERAEIPVDVAKMWEQDTWMLVVRNEQLSYEQEHILELLDDANIPCVILKGSSAAMFYPDPALRIMGDIDLLVKPEQQTAVAEILLKDGYCKNTDESHPFHIHLSKEQIAVEIHRKPNGIYLNENTDGAQKLREFFDDAIERRQYIDGLPVLADDQ